MIKYINLMDLHIKHFWKQNLYCMKMNIYCKAANGIRMFMNVYSLLSPPIKTISDNKQMCTVWLSLGHQYPGNSSCENIMLIFGTECSILLGFRCEIYSIEDGPWSLQGPNLSALAPFYKEKHKMYMLICYMSYTLSGIDSSHFQIK